MKSTCYRHPFVNLVLTFIDRRNDGCFCDHRLLGKILAVEELRVSLLRYVYFTFDKTKHHGDAKHAACRQFLTSVFCLLAAALSFAASITDQIPCDRSPTTCETVHIFAPACR